jgi:Na+/H+-dicarboxylate symporter
MPSVPKYWRAMLVFPVDPARSMPIGFGVFCVWFDVRGCSIYGVGTSEKWGMNVSNEAQAAPARGADPAPQGGLPAIEVNTGLTLGALGLGLLVGLAMGHWPVLAPLGRVLSPVGALWLKGLEMTILPLVSALLVVGIVQMMAAASAGRQAIATLGWIFGIYFGSALLAAFAMPLLLDVWPVPGAAQGILAGGVPGPTPVPGLGDFLLSLLPSNIFAAAAGDAMLPCVAFFSLFAVAMSRLPPAPRAHLTVLFEALSGVMMVMIGWVLRLAPIGVFALSVDLAARTGAAAIGVLAHYVVTVSMMGWAVLAVAPVLAVAGARLALGAYARALMPVGAVAMSTQSSLASLPAMLDACRRLGIGAATADFTLPLCVALFRATGPAMNLAVAIYVARLLGMPLTPTMLAAGVIVAALTEVSSPSLPGAISFVSAVGPVALAMGVPIGPLALLVAVDMLPDITRTVGNVAMDVTVAALVDRRRV